MFPGDVYSDLWSTMDQLLIQYPELSELWLNRDTLAAIRARYPTQDAQREYFRKRAFTAMVVEKIFRVFQLREEVESAEDTEGITIDNPELWRIWSEDLRAEYSEYPEFIEYIEKEVFGSDMYGYGTRSRPE